MQNADDLDFAEAIANEAIAEQGRADGPGPALLLQPCWNCPEGARLALEHVRRHPRWRLSLQSHKWLAIR